MTIQTESKNDMSLCINDNTKSLGNKGREFGSLWLPGWQKSTDEGINYH